MPEEQSQEPARDVAQTPQPVNACGCSKTMSESTGGIICHLLPLCGLILQCLHIPFLNIIAPLVFWLMKRDCSPAVEHHGKESINFQVTISLLTLVAYACFWILVGVPMYYLLMAYSFVMVVYAALQAHKGVLYRYPFTLRLIK